MSLSKRKRKKIDTRPFDRLKVPPKQNCLIMPFMWAYCFFTTRNYKLKIDKINMKGLKPPYLILATHHSFMDFLVTPLAIAPHLANYISELEGFEYYGEWPYRQIGCLGTRKFVDDLALIQNIKKVIDRKGIMVIYPEARYANVGTNSKIEHSVGKLVKLLKVPVVVLNMQGNYLQSPIWNLEFRKQARLHATIQKVFEPDQIKEMKAEEIVDRLQEYLSYDEYLYQWDNKIAITYEERAKGLHLPLYKCKVCGKDFAMDSHKDVLYCKSCKNTYSMDEFGRLFSAKDEEKTSPIHIPDYYEWQRSEVEKEIDEGNYHLDIKVHIESLPNAVNFIDLNTGNLKHTEKGFELHFMDYGKTEKETLFFSSKTMTSVHTEYNYRGMGPCITLSTLDNTYFLFPLEEGFSATKIQFATEYLNKRG